MSVKDYLVLDDKQLLRFEKVYDRYRKMYEDPDNCSPMFVINVPRKNNYTWKERLENPVAMLKDELDGLRPGLLLEDDRVPAVRVQFGTAQVAAAFGCSLVTPEHSPPAAKKHVLEKSSDVYKLEMPSLDAGWYPKLWEYIEVFKENLPEGVHISHPDIQGPFNTAHLVRGNDIMLDFFDDPGAVDALLDIITDYMIKIVPYIKSKISTDREWFFDWGAMWKGTARVCNCSVHMISPEFYCKHVLPRDTRLMEAIGGGRMHYCGTNSNVIKCFLQNDFIHSLDFDIKCYDLWSLSECASKNLTLGLSLDSSFETYHRLIKGEWPEKRNIILFFHAKSMQEGKEALDALRRSVPG